MAFFSKAVGHRRVLGSTVNYNHPLMRDCILACLVNEGSGPLHNLMQDPTLAITNNWTTNYWGKGSEVGVSTYYPDNSANTQRFEHPDSNFANFQTANNFTLWVYATPPRGAGSSTYIKRHDGGGGGRYQLYIENSSPRSFRFGNTGGTLVGTTNVDSLPLDKFYSLCAVNHPDRSFRALYLNGVVEASGGSVSIGAPGGKLILLGDTDGAYRAQGSHAGILIWKRALSADEVKWLAVEPFDWTLPPLYRRFFIGAPTNLFLGPSSIDTAEAFGTPSISPTIGTTGIASAEAFGTPTLITDALAPVGIASDEAFGTPTVTTSAALLSPSGIASAEALGTPAILQSTTARLRIGNRDLTAYLHHESDWSWNMLKGSRGSCSIPLIVEPGDPIAPQTGDFIEIFDPVDVRVWAGTVEQVSVKWIGDAGYHVFFVTGVTLDSLFDTAFVDKTQFDGVPAGDVISDLYTASGVTAVTLGTIDAGETIDALEVTRISDGFASVALRSNKIIFVDPADLTLNFVGATDRPAPWVMGSGPSDIVWESIQWRQSRADFRDTQVIQSPDGTSQTIIAVSPNTTIGRRAARLTMTTGYLSAGALQEATAALRRFSTLPSELVISTDRPGISIGMLLELDVDYPLESSGLLNGLWQVQEVEARMLTGMDNVDAQLRRLPSDLSLGHFRYTLHLVNALAMAVFAGDGVTTVWTLPVVPGSVAYIRVTPDDELYTVSSLGDEVTIEPAMPAGTYGLVGYEGLSTPDTATWMDTWKEMSPVAASAGPAGSSGGGSAQKFIADATLRDLTIQDDAGPHAIVYAPGTGSRVLAVLRQILGADLVVRFNLAGAELLTVTIDSGTLVDDVLEFPMSARAFTVTIASPGVVTVTGATLANDDTVVLHTTGSLPTGLLAETTYWVVNAAGSVFELAASLGGPSIDTSGTQSGNHWLTSTAIPAPVFADKDVLTYDILDSDEAIDDTPGGFANLTVEWE